MSQGQYLVKNMNINDIGSERDCEGVMQVPSPTEFVCSFLLYASWVLYKLKKTVIRKYYVVI